ncbi:MAG: FtsX-like permease family protein [Caldilineaceae bacterium]
MFNPTNLLPTRWRKVWRDLTSNRARTLLVIASITVGIFAVGVVQHINTIIVDEMTRVYEESNSAHARLMVNGVDDALLDALRTVPGVEAAEGRASLTVNVQVAEGVWEPLRITAVPDFADAAVSIVSLDEPEAGPNQSAGAPYRWPAEKEIALERSSLDTVDRLPANLSVGDGLTIEDANGKIRRVELTGLVYDANELPVSFTGTPVGYVDMETFEWLGGGDTYSQVNMRVTGTRAQITDKEYVQRVADDAAAKIEKAGLNTPEVRVMNPGELPMQNIFDALTLILTPLGILALVLGSFLVINTMSALISQQARQIGVMKAIGATGGDLIRMYMGAVLVYSLFSLLIALGLTVFIAGAIELVLSGFINLSVPGFVLPANVLWMEVAIGLLAPSLAALWPIVQGTRVTVREAISDYGVGSGQFGASWIDRILSSIKGLSQPLQLSLRNTFRKRGRLILTLITLTLGGMIFMTVGSVQRSLEGQVDKVLAYNQFDIQLILAREYRTSQVAQAAYEVENVAAVETWSSGSAVRIRADGSESETISISALPPTSQMVDPTLESGRWLLPADQNAIVLSQNVLEDEPDIALGDEIVLEILDKQRTWVVVGFAQTTDFTGAMSGYVNQEYYARITNSVGGAGTLFIKIDAESAASVSEMAAIVEAHFEASNIHVANVMTVDFIRNFTGNFFSIIVSLLLVMGVLIATVGALGLAGTMSTNVLERTREIGVMRAIGASDATILAVVLVEGVIIGLISWLVGAVLAFPTGFALSSVLGLALFQAPLGYVFSANGVFTWLLIVAVLASVASLLPARNASRVTVRAALAYE